MLQKLLIVAMVALAMSSCVSKKAFLAMQDTYIIKTDSLVAVTTDLNTKLSTGELDYESTKQDLLINDAAKNDKILELETQLQDLQAGFNDVTNSLADTKNLAKMSQEEKDKASSQLARMNSDLIKLRQDTVSLNYALLLQRRKSDGLQSSLDQQIKKYTDESYEHRAELTELKKSAESSNLKTKELERQLALKQQQMSSVNDAFIALRKDMLRAKTQGTVLDPNENGNVNKLAKSLGQY